jgi:hypothetical protein
MRKQNLVRLAFRRTALGLAECAARCPLNKHPMKYVVTVLFMLLSVAGLHAQTPDQGQNGGDKLDAHVGGKRATLAPANQDAQLHTNKNSYVIGESVTLTGSATSDFLSRNFDLRFELIDLDHKDRQFGDKAWIKEYGVATPSFIIGPYRGLLNSNPPPAPYTFAAPGRPGKYAVVLRSGLKIVTQAEFSTRSEAAPGILKLADGQSQLILGESQKFAFTLPTNRYYGDSSDPPYLVVLPTFTPTGFAVPPLGNNGSFDASTIPAALISAGYASRTPVEYKAGGRLAGIPQEIPILAPIHPGKYVARLVDRFKEGYELDHAEFDVAVGEVEGAVKADYKLYRPSQSIRVTVTLPSNRYLQARPGGPVVRLFQVGTSSGKLSEAQQLQWFTSSKERPIRYIKDASAPGPLALEPIRGISQVGDYELRLYDRHAPDELVPKPTSYVISRFAFSVEAIPPLPPGGEIPAKGTIDTMPALPANFECSCRNVTLARVESSKFLFRDKAPFGAQSHFAKPVVHFDITKPAANISMPTLSQNDIMCFFFSFPIEAAYTANEGQHHPCKVKVRIKWPSTRSTGGYFDEVHELYSARGTYGIGRSIANNQVCRTLSEPGQVLSPGTLTVTWSTNDNACDPVAISVK